MQEGSSTEADVPAPVVPANFWCLVEKEPGSPTFTEQEAMIPEKDRAACLQLLAASKAGDEAAVAKALATLSTLPIAVETKSGQADHRVFLLPNKCSGKVRETTFGGSGLGYSVWEAGIALSIHLASNPSLVHNKVVMELGSGVGLVGVACGLLGAEEVVLTDFGAVDDGSNQAWFAEEVVGQEGFQKRGVEGANSVVEERWQPTALQSNLAYNIELNELGGTCARLRLDWHASLAPDFRAAREFPVVLGSDLIYYERDAEALVATVLAHLQANPGAEFLLMNRQGRPGLDTVLAALGDAGGTLTTKQFQLVSNWEVTPMILAVFSKKPS